MFVVWLLESWNCMSKSINRYICIPYIVDLKYTLLTKIARDFRWNRFDWENWSNATRLSQTNKCSIDYWSISRMHRNYTRPNCNQYVINTHHLFIKIDKFCFALTFGCFFFLFSYQRESNFSMFKLITDISWGVNWLTCVTNCNS